MYVITNPRTRDLTPCYSPCGTVVFLVEANWERPGLERVYNDVYKYFRYYFSVTKWKLY